MFPLQPTHFIHWVVLQQVRINKHAQLCAVTKGRRAKFVVGNPMRNTSMFLSEAIERTIV
jgi:desulfoferrodoxin (superoxide reductase-like protein)